MAFAVKMDVAVASDGEAWLTPDQADELERARAYAQALVKSTLWFSSRLDGRRKKFAPRTAGNSAGSYVCNTHLAPTPAGLFRTSMPQLVHV
jgi:hypothetical protein